MKNILPFFKFQIRFMSHFLFGISINNLIKNFLKIFKKYLLFYNYLTICNIVTFKIEVT